MMNNKQSEPILIIGGGMVGASAALALCQLGLPVTLVEANPVDECRDNQLPYRLRVSAIQRSSEQLLKNLGVWSEIEARRLLPFSQMHIQDENGFRTLLDAQDLHEPNLGYLIENDVITAAIWSVLKQQPLCQIEQATPTAATQEANGHWCVTLSNRHVIRTPLLIGADGANSQVRRWLGFEQSIRDYHQHCIVGTVTSERDHQQTCWQHYRSEGPFALLPLAEKTCSIAWYVPSNKVEHTLSLNTKHQSQAMTQASALMLGQLTPVGQLAAFPLVKRQTEHYIANNAVLMGDAAHTIHPQAGQGVNLGFLDVIALQSALHDALAHCQPIGDERVLKHYERARLHDASLVQASMDGFNWLFSNHSIPSGLRRLAQPFSQLSAINAFISAQGLYGRLTGLKVMKK
jgi:2-polyprenylphenol 6-hydroxylase